MNDLTIGIVLLNLFCCICFCAGRRAAGISSVRLSQSIQLFAALGMVAYLLFVWDRPVVTRLLPVSNVIILSNWLPLWGSFFLGVYSATRSVSTIRRGVLSSVALLACCYSVVAPVVGTTPQCEASALAFRPLQYQTTPYTCSAACAVSLLKMHGIDASEQELAELCLTRRGTHWMGVYRGLSLKTAGTPWQVEVSLLDLSALKDSSLSPALLSVQVDTSSFPAEVDHGFQEDVGHSVLYLGAAPRSHIRVFDPSPDFGIEEWDHRVLDHIRGGVAIRLVPRNPNEPRVIRVQRRLARALQGDIRLAGL